MVESEVRMGIRGYEGIPTEVPRCLLRLPTAYYGEGMPTAGEVYRAHWARALNRMCHNHEEVVRWLCYYAAAEVQKEENMCARFVWQRRWRLAAGKREHMWRVLQAVSLGEEHMLPTNRKCGTRGPILVLDTDFGGAAHGTVRSVMKEGVGLEVMHVRRKDMKEYQRAGLHHTEFHRDKGFMEWGMSGMYKWMMRRVRGHESRAKGARLTQPMWQE